jgi:hypothetical protein
MRPEVIDRLGDAGVATFNLAVDSVADRKELPKALDPIRPYFEYLIKKRSRPTTTLTRRRCSISPTSNTKTAAAHASAVVKPCARSAIG